MKDKCRKCGRPVSVITFGIYRKVLVDAEAVPAVADMSGEEFVRMDGSRMRGREIPMGTITEKVPEYVYRPHYRTCGVEA